MDFPKTIFLDIDGCILKHHSGIRKDLGFGPVLLEGVLETLQDWDSKGYMIILTTGRRESEREITEQHLKRCGVFYDMLIMGLPRGQRVVINDIKPSYPNEPTAHCINIERNSGLGGIDV